MTFGQRRSRPSDLLKGVQRIDYKNIELLERFLEGGGRLRSRRRTRTPAKQQRKITAAVKRARIVALIPYTAEQERVLGSARGRTRSRRDERPTRGSDVSRDDDGSDDQIDDELMDQEVMDDDVMDIEDVSENRPARADADSGDLDVEADDFEDEDFDEDDSGDEEI